MLPLGDIAELWRVLEDWRKQVKGKRVFPWEKTTYRQFYVDWELLVSAAGLDGVVPKNWRSTMGSEMVAAGINLKAATDWLGHSSVATFEKHYANTGAALREVAERRRKRRDGTE